MHKRFVTKRAKATTDKHKLTQIEVNSQSVFIRVHLWFTLPFSIDRQRLLKKIDKPAAALSRPECGVSILLPMLHSASFASWKLTPEESHMLQRRFRLRKINTNVPTASHERFKDLINI